MSTVEKAAKAKRTSLWRKSRDMTKEGQLVNKHLSTYGAATASSGLDSLSQSQQPPVPSSAELAPHKGLGADDTTSEEESQAEDQEALQAAGQKRHVAPVITSVDQALMQNFDEDQLEEMLDKYREELSNLEVRRSDLETLDRQLDDDRTNLKEAIKSGHDEREQLRVELESLRGELKVLRDQISASNKDRKIHDAELQSFQKTHIGLKDSYEETVWTRVDLEDMLRKLDRDLVIMKNKLGELDKAAAQSADMEAKLVRLKQSAMDKMKEATAIDAFRESYSQRLQKISCDLFDISMQRVRLVTSLEEAIRVKKKDRSNKMTNEAIINASQLIIALQETTQLASASQDIYFASIAKAFQMIRLSIDTHQRETTKLFTFIQSMLAMRRRSATSIQKANTQLERFCLLLRTNKKFTPEDIKTMVAVLNELDAIWPSLDEFGMIQSYGIHRFLQMNSISGEIDALILRRAEISAQTRRQQQAVAAARESYTQLAQENAQMQATLADMIATRKKLESKLR